ncbi:hypothetical protein B0H19DRAFT_1151483, partial [Mycena capillaripes]
MPWHGRLRLLSGQFTSTSPLCLRLCRVKAPSICPEDWTLFPQTRRTARLPSRL